MNSNAGFQHFEFCRGPLAVLLVCCIVAACGKVGDPQPAFIRIPQPVMDLAAHQNAYQAVLSWTNPARYVDGSTATDLATVHVFRNAARLQSIRVEAAGKPQSYVVPIEDAVGVPQTFTVQVETSRGKLGDMSNAARMIPMDVPGPVRELNAVVDQHRIELQWQQPERNGGLANAYVVHRADEAGSHTIKDTHYADTNFEAGKRYVYSVVATRDPDGVVPGIPGPPITVEAVDNTRPAAPRGLHIDLVGDAAILTWEQNTESDLAGYFVYRGEQADGVFTQLGQRVTNNYYEDRMYRPGSLYRISAVDDSKNEGDKSSPAAP